MSQRWKGWWSCWGSTHPSTVSPGVSCFWQTDVLVLGGGGTSSPSLPHPSVRRYLPFVGLFTVNKPVGGRNILFSAGVTQPHKVYISGKQPRLLWSAWPVVQALHLPIASDVTFKHHQDVNKFILEELLVSTSVRKNMFIKADSRPWFLFAERLSLLLYVQVHKYSNAVPLLAATHTAQLHS